MYNEEQVKKDKLRLTNKLKEDLKNKKVYDGSVSEERRAGSFAEERQYQQAEKTIEEYNE